MRHFIKPTEAYSGNGNLRIEQMEYVVARFLDREDYALWTGNGTAIEVRTEAPGALIDALIAEGFDFQVKLDA